MPDTKPSGPEFSESIASGIRGWLLDGVRLLRVRLELFSVEAREHVMDLAELLVLGFAAVLLLGLGLAFFAALVTVLLWDSHRALALGLFTGIFFALGAVALALMVARWRRSRKWFEASLRELSADEDVLRP